MRKDGSSVVFVVVVVVVADPAQPCGHKSHIVKYWITQDMGRHGLSLAGKSGKKGSFFFHIFNLVGQKDAHAYVPTHTCSPLPWPHPLVTFCLRLFCCAYLIKIWSYDYFVRGVDWFEVEKGGREVRAVYVSIMNSYGYLTAPLECSNLLFDSLIMQFMHVYIGPMGTQWVKWMMSVNVNVSWGFFSIYFIQSGKSGTHFLRLITADLRVHSCCFHNLLSSI